ncbi:MAG TPA: response regulator [Candidatus Omnitrophota bacterium]|jgi:CheY-like chemotaxis protein|nr:response regulator [Candidatus Omnitrophota bacterium]
MEDKKYILIVDDEEIIIEMLLRRILINPQIPWEPLVARDGYEALDLMRRFPVAVVILDIQMRNLDGYEVIRKAKEEEPLKDIPIIVSSGVVNNEVKERLAAFQITHFLDKPYTFEQFVQKIQEVVPPG